MGSRKATIEAMLATDELIAEPARYRRANGLPPTPQYGKTRSLVLPVIGREQQEKALSRGALHLVVKGSLQQTENIALSHDNPGRPPATGPRRPDSSGVPA